MHTATPDNDLHPSGELTTAQPQTKHTQLHYTLIFIPAGHPVQRNTWQNTHSSTIFIPAGHSPQCSPQQNTHSYTIHWSSSQQGTQYSVTPNKHTQLHHTLIFIPVGHSLQCNPQQNTQLHHTLIFISAGHSLQPNPQQNTHSYTIHWSSSKQGPHYSATPDKMHAATLSSICSLCIYIRPGLLSFKTHIHAHPSTHPLMNVYPPTHTHTSTPPQTHTQMHARTSIHPHSEYHFPTPSSKLCQIWLRHWRGTLYLWSAPSERFGYWYDCGSNLAPKHALKHETHVKKKFRLTQVFKKVLSRIKRFWFYLSWCKQHGNIKQASDIIWVVHNKLNTVWAPTKNCLLVDSFLRPMAWLIRQWLKEGCRKPVLGVCHPPLHPPTHTDTASGTAVYLHPTPPTMRTSSEPQCAIALSETHQCISKCSMTIFINILCSTTGQRIIIITMYSFNTCVCYLSKLEHIIMRNRNFFIFYVTLLLFNPAQFLMVSYDGECYKFWRRIAFKL